MFKAPLLPELDVPVLKTNSPLTPVEPAFAVDNSNEPLDETKLYPLVTDTRPPDNPGADDETPPDKTTSPPDPLLLEPTVMYTEPPRPEDAEPDPM
jgi:hypothetical protein